MKLKIFLIGLILLISLGVVSAADNSTDLSMDDGLDDVISEDVKVEKTFDDLQNEINDAKANGTVKLEGTYIASNRTINVPYDGFTSTSFVIDGQGKTVIDGNNSKDLLFLTNISSEHVTFKNIKFINSNYEIIRGECSLIIENCEFLNNSGDSLIYGGWYNNCSIINSIFDNNRATNSIIDSYSDNLIISNCNFTNNKNAILEISRSLNVLLCNVNLFNNIINDDAIYVGYDCEKFTLMNSSFINNKVSQILLRQLAQRGDIVNCNFEDNQGDLFITFSNFDNCKFINTTASFQLIDIGSNDYIRPVIKNSIFRDNHVYCDAAQSSLLVVSGKVDVESCEFTNNTAPYGGAIYWLGDGKVDNCSFANNYAKIGGAIFVSIPKLVLTNNKFINNKAVSYNDVYGFFSFELPKESYYYGEKITVKVKDKFTNKYVDGMRFDFVFWKNKIRSGKSVSACAKSFNTLSLSAAKYVAIIHLDDDDVQASLTKTVTIKKAPTSVKAPKVTNKFKKSKYFKVTVKNKVTKDPVKKTVIKLKIGKKTYNVKTDSKGVAKFNTKKLKVGKYKVVISSGSDNYKISAKSTIKIKK